MDEFRYIGGRLSCEGVPAAALAERFGTPLYVYSRATLEGHFDRLSAAFGELRPTVCFSLKSCGNVHVARVLAGRGAGMDVVSGGELMRARLAGTPAERIVFAGVGKTDAELDAALGAGGGEPIGWFNVESEAEFEALSAAASRRGVRARAALRVNPDVDARTHAHTTTATKEVKFGVDIARAVRFFERYGRDPRVELAGIHLHLGSPIYTVEPYVEAVRRALGLIDELAGKGFRVSALNLGGGFGADYESDRSPPAAEYARAITPLLRERVSAGLRTLLEPGRTIVANAGVLLTRVVYVKDGAAGPGGVPSKRFAICDAGMNALVRPALYDAFHFVWPTDPGERFAPPRRARDVAMAGLETYDVVGPICETADHLARGRALPPVSRGDLLAVFTAGAYGMTMASNYNGQPRPAEVLVEGDGARLIRRRETWEELVAAEMSLDR